VASHNIDPFPGGAQWVLNVFVMNADGSGVAQVTHNESISRDQRQPRLSRDRRRVVYLSTADGGPFWITVVNIDGSGERVVSDFGEDEFDPVVHPGGRELAFVSRCCEGVGIYRVNVDGTGRRRLSETPGFDDSPAFSPAGGQIAFVSSRDGNAEIYVMNRDGSNQRRLTDHPAGDFAPVFSADSRTIAFVSRRGGRDEIYVMNWDGSDVRRLTTEGGGPPAFSPDGRRIAFAFDGDVYVMNADGSGRRRLARGGRPVFSPDGRSVAFFAQDPTGLATYAVNVDGTGLERLSDPASGLVITSGLDWK
jgi:TolB protein